MKSNYSVTYLLYASFILAAIQGTCQTVSVPSGVVGTSSNSFMGIGTSEPNENLTVSSNSNVYIGMEKPAFSNKFTLGIGGHSGILNYTAGDPLNSKLYFQTNNTSRLFIDNEGNIGIGTTTLTPSMTLDVRGDIINGAVSTTAYGIYTIEGRGSVLRLKSYGNETSSFNQWTLYSGTTDGNLYFGQETNTSTSRIDHVTFKSNGKVGIGTTDPGCHKLAVEGSIGAHEIKVEIDGWCDFVFESNYDLRPLEEVENFILENKHLPEIPSEEEVIENGINLGEMDAKLLQKIEELTLYLIEQNKEIKELKELTNQQQIEIERLKNE